MNEVSQNPREMSDSSRRDNGILFWLPRVHSSSFGISLFMGSSSTVINSGPCPPLINSWVNDPKYANWILHSLSLNYEYNHQNAKISWISCISS